MEALETDIRKLKDSIQLLLKKYEQLKKENKLLVIKLQEQQSLVLTGQEKISLLEQRIDAGKMGLEYLEEEDKTRLKERIDHYLADIEKCLALLNS